MNATERRYADRLDLLLSAKEIRGWMFEGIRLRVCAAGGKPAFYTPDFLVQMADGEVQIHETKGWTTEAGRLRIKAAAGEFPFRFFVASHSVQHGWKVEEFAIGKGYTEN